MRILATNDDGIDSPGLRALVRVLSSRDHDVAVIAPSTQQSAISRALTMNRILRSYPVEIAGFSGTCLRVEGTPVDCVKLGVLELLSARPDLVVSGVNIGTNMGGDVLYSGTVAAAMEAAYLGLPAVAYSTSQVRGGVPDFGMLDDVVEWSFALIEEHPLPRGTILNVNFPQQVLRGFRTAPLGSMNYNEHYVRRVDPRGGAYYWLDGGSLGEKEDARTDVYWFDNGYCTATPLKLDITDHDFLHDIRDWRDK